MANITGTPGSDNLPGNALEADVIDALEGNDTSWAGGADTFDDLVVMGDGDDLAGAAGGNDTMIGDAHNGATDLGGFITSDGSDTLYSGDGDDLIITGTYNNDGTDATLADAVAGNLDAFVSGTADDVAWAGAGNDAVLGAGGNDILGGGAGNDYVSGGAGNDVIYGAAGDDTLMGGAGNDTIYNGAGSDSVDGGAGNDELWGGAGNDTITTGTGNDVVGFIAGNGNDTVTDFSLGTDVLDLQAFAADFADAAAVVAAMADVTGGVTLTLAPGQVVTLQGLSVADFAGSTDAWVNLTGTPEASAVEGSEFDLTVGADDLTGTAGNDTFEARVVQNIFGEQTNQFASGDQIDGGDGTDTLEAKVQMASALNNGPAAAINAETVDVENILIDAVTTGTEGAETVEINAKDMNGVDRFGSVMSDASLTYYNVNTLTDSGDYGDRRLTEEVTIRMDHTGNDMAIDRESDMTVLFDQDYLLRRGDVASGSTLTVELMDMDSALTGGAPLLDNPFGQITFTMDGVSHDLVFGTDANTYAELLVDIQAALAADPAFANLTAALGGTFTATDTDLDPGGSATGTSIVITNSGPETLQAISMVATGAAPAGKDFHTNFTADDPSTDGYLITSQVELEKVGRAGDGGVLTIGGMSTGITTDSISNNWGDGDGIPGVERFNVTVSGDDTQDSSLAALNSTNNALQEVYVDEESGSEADLVIGNSNTTDANGFGISYADDVNGDGTVDANDLLLAASLSNVDLSSVMNNGLKDVRVFDSSAFANDATVYAHVSDEAVAKYMDLVDDAADPAADNANFQYSFGAGDDLLNINIDKSNLAQVGTATREDFTFAANMGAGDDVVEFQIGDGMGGYDYANSVLESWYVNMGLVDGLTINTDAGDDTVRTWGSSIVSIDAGAGNDAVYTDNSGVLLIDSDGDYISDGGTFVDTASYNAGRAVWAFNHVDNTMVTDANDIDDLESDVNDGTDASGAGLYTMLGATVTLTFKGIERTFTINEINTTDLEMNQIIKNIINNDEHLSDLLLAEDGPANTLTVSSLIDGLMAETDLDVTVTAPTTLSATQVQQLVAAGLATDAATAVTAVGAGVTAFTTKGDYDTTAGTQAGFATELDGAGNAIELEGANSSAANGNTVTDGDGQDTIVLSTSEDPAGGFLGYNLETVVVSDDDGDTNVVVNFTGADDDGTGASVSSGAHLATFNAAVEFAYDVFDFSGSATTYGLVYNELDGETGTVLDDSEAAIINWSALTLPAPLAAVTWDTVTEAQLLTILANSGYGADATGLSTETDTSLLIIVNDTDDVSEGKAFELTSVGNVATFASADLQSVIDLGDTGWNTIDDLNIV